MFHLIFISQQLTALYDQQIAQLGTRQKNIMLRVNQADTN